MTTQEQIKRRRDDQSVVATLAQPRRREAVKAPRQQLASLHRCAACGVWWGSSPQHTPGEHWVFHLMEGHDAQYNWVDYRGWRTGRDAAVCPECLKEASMPAFSLPVRLA